MANKKISQLTSAPTTPLSGTEVVPIVQSSTTYKATVSQFTNGVAITPASVNNCPIGATTPSTGRFTSPLLTNASGIGGAAGDAVHRLQDALVIAKRGLSVTASTGTVDFSVATGGNSFQGFLCLVSTATATANRRTQSTYSVFGRGTTSSFQQIATTTGSLGGVNFTLTVPSDGVIRFTNTQAETVDVYLQFFGGEGG